MDNPRIIIQGVYLLHRHTSRQQLDQITGLEDRSRIERLSGRLDGHATFDQIQRAGNTEFLERSCHNGPCFLQVDFTVLGEQSGEGRFFSETTGDIVIGLEGFDLVATNLQLVSDWFETFVVLGYCVVEHTFHLSMSSVSHGLSLL